MKKQDIAKEVFRKLNIQTKSTFFSAGGTVTKEGFDEVAKKLIVKNKSKKNIANVILQFLNISTQNNYFSSGGTVTKKFWENVLKKL